ncbi:MAG: reverse transcriptase [Candidatus Tokpelaia sp.]|nr:MAG: reverse transcriptase [Candidatus Tokpelaia sp.]KAA6206883.1 MAG: reverse transcriptase [Candidatus Tokpelaia sp.]
MPEPRSAYHKRQEKSLCSGYGKRLKRKQEQRFLKRTIIKNLIFSYHASKIYAMEMKKAKRSELYMCQSTGILEMSWDKARYFLLKNESYCTLDLPPYFNFSALIDKIKPIEGSPLRLSRPYPSAFKGVNYTFYSNKDGHYAWRPIQLVHPVLYVDLVYKVTDPINWQIIRNHFSKCSQNKKIQCTSIPAMSTSKRYDKAELIITWWKKFEQQSIELALDYAHLFHADITDCYSSVYTHSIAWALHSKKVAKTERQNKNLLGNIIDKSLQNMSYGQTNGIPQGSVLMDFVAEILLAYTDRVLSATLKRAKINNYHILRHRDDYRIFVNNPQNGEKILKFLTEILLNVGLKLSPEKTKKAPNLIYGSIKSDKIYWIQQNLTFKNISLTKHLLIIFDLAQKYPNSGSILRALNDFYNRLKQKITRRPVQSPLPLISISVQMALNSPKAYPYIAAIISLLIENGIKARDTIIGKIIDKFQTIPNTGHLLIWLQRININLIGPPTKAVADILEQEKLCQLVSIKNPAIWDNHWLKDKCLITIMANTQDIIDKAIMKNLPAYITQKEVEIFREDYVNTITIDTIKAFQGKNPPYRKYQFPWSIT